jgi:hypothetical protein
MKGINRKAMKNGNPSNQKIADKSSEPARRPAAIIQFLFIASPFSLG